MSRGQVSAKNNRERNKDKHETYQKRWNAAHPEKVREINLRTQRKRRAKGTTLCTILKTHHRELKEDPERLTTEFIVSLMR